MNGLLITIISYLGISLILILVLQIVYSKKRKKNQALFSENFPLVEKAIKEINFLDVCYYINKILWSPYMSKAKILSIVSFLKNHKEKDFESIELLKEIEFLFDSRGWNPVDE